MSLRYVKRSALCNGALSHFKISNLFFRKWGWGVTHKIELQGVAQSEANVYNAKKLLSYRHIFLQ